ncbi:phosphoribosylaminoimidazolesuccinocarboxamide synthase [uncultured Fusobacterium sp.]|jgi:phosphoribosylaminoimidazole-succinocarboxamide synthase|uniref:phosphoribosylaminoimidazolesuccinocarboxamide synthase n=1 Tax=uncultured Fusobacterium sp. TaxID=159267 RepID=UPI0015A5488C|nr:phosphoribosylaminoimidazolesuccinocarboxamide synthase [uncultured Fusobacterium sp.]
MEKREFIYEGKAKRVYGTDNENLVIIYFKDDATAGNGVKKGTILNKGVINNKITAKIFKILGEKGIKTHFVEVLNDREQLCEKVKIFPLEVTVRNVIAGSMSKRLGIEEGTIPPETIFEIGYKNDELGDPLINDYHAYALGIKKEELEIIYSMARKINQLLIKIFDEIGINLIDFKIEFGRNCNGEIILADEITPDTCRFWDKRTGEKLDKDRFRRDMGNIEEAYIEVAKRLEVL